MNVVWALCLLLGAIDNTTPPPPPLPVSLLIPESLTRLLAAQPGMLQHHEGFLKELAARPALAQAETAWWQASTIPALRELADHFETALANSDTARLRFDTFYKTLAHSPEVRTAVETLIRTELERARTDRSFPAALRFIRANPDIGLRFLKDSRQVRPLPAPLEAAYKAFGREPEWTQSLFQALDAVAQLPDAHVNIFPWWRELDQLDRAEQGPRLDDALEERPNEYWKWHERNLNLANVDQAAPWMRYWSSLVHRDPDLAREYGPFMNQLLEEPELLRQHLADLQDKSGDAPKNWPPKSAPPKLEPLDRKGSIEKMRRSIERPTVDRPEGPAVDRPQRPARPSPPTRPDPDHSSGGTRDATELRTAPTFRSEQRKNTGLER